MVEWEMQETVVLCVAKYSRRNGGVVGMHSDTMAAKLRWMSCRLLIGWLDDQSGPTCVKASQTCTPFPVMDIFALIERDSIR